MDTAHKAPAFKTDEEQKVSCAAAAKLPDDRRDNWDDLDLSLIVMIWRSGGLSHRDFAEEIDTWLVRRSKARQERLEILQRSGVNTGATSWMVHQKSTRERHLESIQRRLRVQARELGA